MSGEYLENRTFDEIHVGDSECFTRTLTSQDLHLFAAVSGDVNPAHVDEQYARQLPLGQVGRTQPLGRRSFPVCSGPSSPVPGPCTSRRTCDFSGR